jgi:hypothetical protein
VIISKRADDVTIKLTLHQIGAARDPQSVSARGAATG